MVDEKPDGNEVMIDNEEGSGATDFNDEFRLRRDSVELLKKISKILQTSTSKSSGLESSRFESEYSVLLTHLSLFYRVNSPPSMIADDKVSKIRQRINSIQDHLSLSGENKRQVHNQI